MSRSYKHHPHVKCEKSCKKGKRWANKKVRQFLKNNPISNGCQYQKVFNTCDICDYGWSWTWEDEVAACIRRGTEPTQEDWYSWYKYYKMK